MMDESADAVRAALRRVLPNLSAGAARALRYRALEGGRHGRSFLVTVDGRELVLRLPTAGADGLIDIATEARAMSAAAAAGLAPSVAGVDAAAKILLTEYRGGAVRWTPVGAREPRNIRRAAALLRALHAVDVDVPAYAAERIAARYIAGLAAADVPADARAEELQQLARDYDRTYPPTGLCHNDLVAANVLDDGELALIDFEYAACGAPILDLANLAAMNDYAEPQRRALLAAYYLDAGAPFTAIQFAAVVRMVRLTALFWARLAERQLGDPAYALLAEHMTEALQRDRL